MTILSLSNVSKSFGALKVTESVSFSLARGEALGIIGPNCAGKSTLFNLITGNFKADAGIGRTFQKPQPFEKLSAFENLLVAASLGMKGRDVDTVGRCAQILDDTGLMQQVNKPASSLGAAPAQAS